MSAEAGRPFIKGFALFHLLSLERLQVLFQDEGERSRIWFWTCSLEILVIQVKILSRQLDGWRFYAHTHTHTQLISHRQARY